MTKTWNETYSNHHDYLQLPTHQVGKLCHVARSAPKTALDIGCGTGQLARDLYHRGYQVTGIDISTEAISQAQASTIYTQGITFAVRDITKPPLPPCHYGLITCKYVVAFIADRAAFFRAIGTFLEPTGVVAIITPAQPMCRRTKPILPCQPRS